MRLPILLSKQPTLQARAELMRQIAAIIKAKD